MIKSIIIVILVVVVFILMSVTFVEERIIYYNCDIAEISPDIPIEAKEKCRELRRAKKNNFI